MDPAIEIERKGFSRQNAMNSVIGRFESPVQQFYCGAAVLVTGGSGFLGKQLIEKLFRSTKLKKVFILIRPKRGKTASERLSEVLQDPVYDALHREQASFVDRIVPIEGDITQLGLAINEDNRKTIIDETDMIFHVAATIRFDEPLGIAAITNVRGTREILNLARECRKLRSFVHVSTAYSHATFENLGDQVLEKFYLSPVPPEVIIQLAESVDKGILNQITPELLKGWPNTYTFTKALGEELIRTTAADLPICIMRPSIVVCTNCEPVPGWVDWSSVFGPSAIPLGISMGVIHSLLTREHVKLDVVPMDYVNNACIVAAWETDRRRQARERDIKIYTLSSSARNPLYELILRKTLQNDVATRVVSPLAMWYCFVVDTKNKWVFLVLHFFLNIIPGIITDTVLLVLRKKPRLNKMYSILRKIPMVQTFYINHDWIFDDNNAIELYNSLSVNDQAIYNFDICKLEWVEHILIWCVGFRKYIIKDGLIDTQKGLKRQIYFRILTYILGGLLYYILWLILCYLFKIIMFNFGFD